MADEPVDESTAGEPAQRKKPKPKLVPDEPGDDDSAGEPAQGNSRKQSDKYQPETWTEVWEACDEFARAKSKTGVGRQGWIVKFEKLFSEPALR